MSWRPWTSVAPPDSLRAGAFSLGALVHYSRLYVGGSQSTRYSWMHVSYKLYKTDVMNNHTQLNYLPRRSINSIGLQLYCRLAHASR